MNFSSMESSSAVKADGPDRRREWRETKFTLPFGVEIWEPRRMNRPPSGRHPGARETSHRPSGRVRAYTLHSRSRPAPRTTKFRCRNCGQKVCADASLSRISITCPRCKEQVRAPQLLRYWLEICGGIVLFLSGLAIGHTAFGKGGFSAPAPAPLTQDAGNKESATKQDPPKPHWLVGSTDN